MPRYIILAQSAATAAALDGWRTLMEFRERYGSASCPEPVVQLAPAGLQSVADAYAVVATRIEDLARGADPTVPINEVTVLVDRVTPRGLTAVAEGTTWDHLVALLVLSFPEVR